MIAAEARDSTHVTVVTVGRRPWKPCLRRASVRVEIWNMLQGLAAMEVRFCDYELQRCTQLSLNGFFCAAAGTSSKQAVAFMS